MEELLFVYAAIVEEEESGGRRKILKGLRDKSDPFTMQDTAFINTFRFPKSLCKLLISELEPHDVQKSNIPFDLRFLTSLYFYGHGSYQKCVGNNYMLSMSQSSVSRALHFISKLIVDVKGSEICFPSSAQDVSDAKKGFYTKFGIKGTIGAIDCTHIGIVSPSTTDATTPLSLFMNRKGFYSLNVEAVCDHRLLFTAVNARYPGSCHDSGIWTTSPTRMHLTNTYNTQSDSWLLGDQGYPLEPWLLTPVAEPSNAREVRYNKLHAKARNTIERAFGVLKSRFRCLSKHRILHYSPEKASLIIYACTILHNILLKHGVAADLGFEEVLEESQDTEIVFENPNFREGARVRERYIMSL
ncbi:putative nuclease HARBI1 [Bactrocera dorsalis]|uniref:Nuclease HARBI1 n=1 Tax=Bactrocera dorsalis TaxID=27457 RepID=A0ABM3K1I9_BACDO|nr:putative nuclease HARBI1 [Bactrocera dorsalis]